jgi:hypothetical protein
LSSTIAQRLPKAEELSMRVMMPLEPAIITRDRILRGSGTPMGIRGGVCTLVEISALNSVASIKKAGPCYDPAFIALGSSEVFKVLTIQGDDVLRIAPFASGGQCRARGVFLIAK